MKRNIKLPRMIFIIFFKLWIFAYDEISDCISEVFFVSMIKKITWLKKYTFCIKKEKKKKEVSKL